jgi:hypothetical protein
MNTERTEALAAQAAAEGLFVIRDKRHGRAFLTNPTRPHLTGREGKGCQSTGDAAVGSARRAGGPHGISARRLYHVSKILRRFHQLYLISGF